MRHLKKFNEATEVESSSKNFQPVFQGFEGYHIDITKDKQEKIKNALGVSDDDIKFGYEEMQEDRTNWFATIMVNVDALAEDKKTKFSQIVKAITHPTVPSDAGVEKKSGLMAKMKSFFTK